MLHIISARQIQREYKKVLEKANKMGKPIMVIAHNKPVGAIIGLDLLEKLRLEELEKEALNEYEQGKMRSISTKRELEQYFKELEKETKMK